MIGAMVATWLVPRLLAAGVPAPLALAIVVLTAIPACMVLSVAIDRVAYRPLRNAPRLAPLITAIGMSIVLQTVAMMAGLLLVHHTRLGRAMRATAGSPRIASLMGVDANRVIAATFAVGAALAALPFVLDMGGNRWVRLADFALLYVMPALGLKSWSATPGCSTSATSRSTRWARTRTRCSPRRT